MDQHERLPAGTNGQKSPPPLLEVRGLSKRFPVGGWFGRSQVHALEDASFTLDRGRVTALVGESGSGKSTTARLVARLIEPTAGEIVLNGRDMLKSEPRSASLAYRADVQMIFQDPFASLNPVHTVGYHLERPLRVHAKARGGAGRREQVASLLEAVGLTPATDFVD
ncbi:MAG: oligopeptide/dipeptide transporter, ATPase subunit, partial [Thermomicrobiales bacterium]|nr:oligopeptide/dipeptide transporter, ATPase subunit [Thermomicrobiales bacterium]